MPGPLSGRESEKLLEEKDPRGRSEETEATGFHTDIEREQREGSLFFSTVDLQSKSTGKLLTNV